MTEPQETLSQPSQLSQLVNRVLAPIFILVMSAGLSVALYLSRQAPPMRPLPPQQTDVRLGQVQLADRRVQVTAMGTVIPAEQVVLQPQVSGRVRSRSPDLVAGGQVKAGALLVSIEAQDYRFAQQQQAARLAEAEAAAAIEAGRARVAKKEWALLTGAGEGSEAQRALALRAPQAAAAAASLKGAQAALQQARLNLRRTQLRAPFNATVQAAGVEQGQLVSPNSALATLVGSDRFWVRVLLPVSEVPKLELPDAPGAPASVATITQELGADQPAATWAGAALRLESALDAKGRMAQLLVEVPSPLAVSATRPVPLLLGAYVKVQLQGRAIPQVAAIPRRALRSGDKVWLYVDGQLKIRPVKVAWRGAEQVYVRSGLRAGDRVVLSPISTPVDGLKLRPLNPEAVGLPPTPSEPAAGAPGAAQRSAQTSAQASAGSKAPGQGPGAGAQRGDGAAGSKATPAAANLQAVGARSPSTPTLSTSTPSAPAAATPGEAR